MLGAALLASRQQPLTAALRAVQDRPRSRKLETLSPTSAQPESRVLHPMHLDLQGGTDPAAAARDIQSLPHPSFRRRRPAACGARRSRRAGYGACIGRRGWVRGRTLPQTGCAAAQVAHHFPEKPGHASALSGGLLRRRSPGATQCCHTFTMVHRCPPVRSPYGFPPWFWWRLKMLITAQSRQRAIGWVVHARCSAFGIGDPLLCPFPCGRVHARGSERCPSICSQISRLLGAAFGQCAEQWCA
jgi:hypothetical protein